MTKIPFSNLPNCCPRPHTPFCLLRGEVAARAQAHPTPTRTYVPLNSCPPRVSSKDHVDGCPVCPRSIIHKVQTPADEAKNTQTADRTGAPSPPSLCAHGIGTSPNPVCRGVPRQHDFGSLFHERMSNKPTSGGGAGCVRCRAAPLHSPFSHAPARRIL